MTVTATDDEPDDFRRTLVELYPSLIRFAGRLGEKPADAQDLVHAAIERGLRKRRSFHGDVPDRWIRTIIRNLFIDRRRHFQVLREIPCSSDRLASEPAQAFGEVCDGGEPTCRRSDAYNMEDLRRAVRRLPSSLRVIYEMASFERTSYREIGLRLSLNLDTVGTRLHRARRALRVILESESGASSGQDGKRSQRLRILWDDSGQEGRLQPHLDDRSPDHDEASATLTPPLAGAARELAACGEVPDSDSDPRTRKTVPRSRFETNDRDPGCVLIVR